MNDDKLNQLIHEGRASMMHIYKDVSFKSDQQLGKPQPPLTKPSMSDEQIQLPLNFEELKLEDNLWDLLKRRKSNRVYTQESMSLLQLSFLLWATQGVKSIRGKNYATLRTVPCGGARHPFETYFIIKNVDNLKQGLYHYLPMQHCIEYLNALEDIDKVIDTSVVGQTWVTKANVLFIYTFVPYRAEWRYGCVTYRNSSYDLGHVGENLYLAATALNLGTCGIGAFDENYINETLLDLHDDNEFVIYTQPVGTIDPTNIKDEDAFYAFLKDEE